MTFEYKLSVSAFASDLNEDYEYTLKNRPKSISTATRAIKQAMKGFKNVKVEHVDQHKYTITFESEDSSEELRNLAQMGEFAPIVVKRLGSNKGFNLYGKPKKESSKRVKKSPKLSKL